MNSAELLARFGQQRLVVVIRGTDVRATIAAATTLLECGVRTLEITLTLADAETAIREVVQAAPAGSSIGAGTVLSAADVDRSIAAGAQFIVTPSVSPSVAHAASLGVPVLAGAFTPTEIAEAMDRGASAVKLFPISAVGVGYLKAVGEPFPSIPLIPVGGVSLESIPTFFAAGAVAVGVGGPLLGNAAHAGGDLAGLRARAADFVRAVTP